MEFYFFYTEVTWCWWENNVRKKAHESVIVFAQSHSHAAGILEENYGDELFSIDKIEIISEGNTLPLSIVQCFKRLLISDRYHRTHFCLF